MNVDKKRSPRRRQRGLRARAEGVLDLKRSRGGDDKVPPQRDVTEKWTNRIYTVRLVLWRCSLGNQKENDIRIHLVNLRSESYCQRAG